VPWWDLPLRYAGIFVSLVGLGLLAFAGWGLRGDKLVLASLLVGTAFAAFLLYIFFLPRFVLDLLAAIAAMLLVGIVGPLVLDKLRRSRTNEPPRRDN
jgi:hypothetical protein